MPPFGSRKARTPETVQPETAPEPAQPSATERLAALLAEQSSITTTLAEHRAQREKWLTDGGALDRIVQLGSEDDALKLRAEQLAALLPAAQEAVQREHAAQRDTDWQERVPGLDAAMQDTVEAIRAFDEASARYRRLHLRAQQEGFDPELRENFVTPPHAQINPWVFATFVSTVEQCKQRRATMQAVATAPTVAFDAAALFDLPPIERFVPKRVPMGEVERISVMAEPRRVRIVHGPARTSSLNVGISRMRVGEEHVLPAKAAFMLTYSGIAEYADVETAEAATAA